ncbi:MAG TPA: YdeI/OmpD-associated family protein [Bacteroidota bacterium]|nr:YdeI/OmpD-associated family protein [Bacteroidota bacterium]
MEIGRRLYVKNRQEWRRWLSKHHRTAKDIWLIYYKKGSTKRRIPYNDAVEEALCFGWIDSIVKAIDSERYVQRFSPRRPGSPFSAMNLERIRRLIAQRKMTRFGLEALKKSRKPHFVESLDQPGGFSVAEDILKELQKHPKVWKNFQKFPSSYKRIRIGWIEAARRRREVFQQRLRYFIKMTAQNKRFGMVQ